jgi:hypothetical protein
MLRTTEISMERPPFSLKAGYGFNPGGTAAARTRTAAETYIGADATGLKVFSLLQNTRFVPINRKGKRTGRHLQVRLPVLGVSQYTASTTQHG